MTANPELVDATDLEAWAGRLEAKPLLPRLVRKLIAATPGVTEVSARAGEGIRLSGWDGEVKARKSSPFVPRYTSRWEMGTGADPGRKAQQDYRKRTKAYPAAVRKKMTFVFVTPRRWETKSDWRDRKLKKKKWRDVRVIDADDLEAWLDEAPAVHYWFSEELGRAPRSARTLEAWWEKWSSRLSEPLPPALLLAGRDESVKKLRGFLGEEPRLVSVRSNSRDESLAFIAAALGTGTTDEAAVPCLVVSTADAWNRCVEAAAGGVLVPDFEDPDARAAIRAGHHVLVPLGGGDTARPADVQLARIARDEGRKALEAAGVAFERADRRATHARSSLTALRRALALDPRVTRPPWAERQSADRLAPLVLVGSWDVSEEDKKVAADIVGCDWSDLERDLLGWAASDDPPFRRSGGSWRLASSEDAWTLLHPALTTDDLKRWHGAALEVLEEADPTLDLDPDERPYANLQGISRRWSPTLRRGLAEGVALLGAFGETQLADDVLASAHAQRVVVKLLAGTNADASGRAWQSLAGELPLLGEAAPDTFLDAVEEALSGEEPILAAMFRDAEGISFLSSWSPHTSLLWALETLCWSTDHLLRAALSLARLADIDPGGRLANRPSASLRTVFLPWIPRTAANSERRLEVLDAIRERYANVAWPLLVSLLPRIHDHSSSTSSPRFRDWRPDHEGVTMKEFADNVTGLVERACEDAGSNGARWAQLLGLPGGLSSLTDEQRDYLLSALERLAPDELEGEEGLDLWETLEDTVAKHREFADAQWALPEEPLIRLEAVAERLEPEGSVERYARFFDWRPHLEGVDRRDYAAFNEALAEARREAVAKVHAEVGTSGLLRLAEASPLPRHLGAAVAQAVGNDVAAELLPLLGRGDDAGEMAAGWATQMAYQEGGDWIRVTAQGLEQWDVAAQVTFLLALPAIPSTWELVERADASAAEKYWDSVNPYVVPDEHAEAMTEELLVRDRPWAVVDLLSLYCYRDEQTRWRPPVELVAKTLEQALKAEPRESARSGSLAHEIGVLLDYLKAEGVRQKVLASFEWAYFEALEHERVPEALYAELANDPRLFVEIVSYGFRGDSEEPREQDERSLGLARNSWAVLDRWRTPPGTAEGKVDGEKLKAWVGEARELFKTADRVGIGDDQIGHVLSGSPPGTDDAWPAEPVRDLVEELESKAFDVGLSTGKRNSRGITSRGVYDGGDQERALAATYREWSERIGARWPRAARLVREIAEDYEAEARVHDAEAEGRGDEG